MTMMGSVGITLGASPVEGEQSCPALTTHALAPPQAACVRSLAPRERRACDSGCGAGGGSERRLFATTTLRAHSPSLPPPALNARLEPLAALRLRSCSAAVHGCLFATRVGHPLTSRERQNCVPHPLDALLDPTEPLLSAGVFYVRPRGHACSFSSHTLLPLSQMLPVCRRLGRPRGGACSLTSVLCCTDASQVFWSLLGGIIVRVPPSPAPRPCLTHTIHPLSVVRLPGALPGRNQQPVHCRRWALCVRRMRRRWWRWGGAEVDLSRFASRVAFRLLGGCPGGPLRPTPVVPLRLGLVPGPRWRRGWRVVNGRTLGGSAADGGGCCHSLHSV